MAEVVNKEEQIPRLYTRLQRAVDDEDDLKVLDAAQKILDLSPTEEEAVLCKLVSLIHLSKFSAALSFVKERAKKANSPSQYHFEEAYCLYRQEKYEESLKVLSRLPQGESRVRELQAQIAYKAEKYHKAHSTFKGLLEEGMSSTAELRTNYYATACLTSPSYAAASLDGRATDTMEQCFNLACCYLVCGQADQAEQLLVTAENLHRQSLEDEEYSEEEIAEEMVLLQVLKGYTLQVQDKPKEALSYYNSVLKLRPDDPALVAVVANNMLVLNGNRDVFDSKKRVKVLVSEGASRKLTCVQRSTLLFNRSMFALHTNQLDQCRELIAKLRQLQPPQYPLSILAESALLYRERKHSGALQLLQSHLEASKKGDLAVDLYAVLAQLYLIQGDTARACTTLKDLPDYALHVGVASTLAQMYSGMGQTEEALKVLQDMLQSWVQCYSHNSNLHTLTSDLVSKVAKFQLLHNHAEVAAATLEKVRKGRQLDLRGVALLIAAYAQFSPQKAEELRKDLPTFKTGREVDVEALEQAPMVRHTRGGRATAQRTEVASIEAVKEKKKRKRKPHLPKNYDPNVLADPERWVTLRERSYYRRSRRKGVSATARGSQGIGTASAALMNQLDASKPTRTDNTDTTGSGEGGASGATPSPKVVHKPSSQQAKKKPKKKKGNKW